MVVYDYDLPAMEATSVAYADALFVAALWGVTNILLFAAAGIVIDAFAAVRRARASQPSLLDDAAELLEWGAAAAAAPGTAARWLSKRDGASAPRAFGPLGAGADATLPPYATILALFDAGGALAGVETVTPEVLAAALGVSPVAAARLVAELLASTPEQLAAGVRAALPPEVAAALEALRAPARFRAQKSAVFSEAAAGAAAWADEGAAAEGGLSRGEAQLSAQVADIGAALAEMRAELAAARRGPPPSAGAQ